MLGLGLAGLTAGGFTLNALGIGVQFPDSTMAAPENSVAITTDSVSAFCANCESKRTATNPVYDAINLKDRLQARRETDTFVSFDEPPLAKLELLPPPRETD
jgi:hypothetical protein